MREFDLQQAAKWSGVVLITITGLLHLITAGEHFHHAFYVGVLFLLNLGAALVAAYGIIQEKLWGWLLGAAVAGGAFASFLASRTVGLPKFTHGVGHWGEPFGILSLIVEGIFVAIFVWVAVRRRRELQGMIT